MCHVFDFYNKLSFMNVCLNISFIPTSMSMTCLLRAFYNKMEFSNSQKARKDNRMFVPRANGANATNNNKNLKGT